MDLDIPRYPTACCGEFHLGDDIMAKEKLRWIATGGTIAATATEEGDKPTRAIRELEQQVPHLREQFRTRFTQLFPPYGKDSTLIDHRDWRTIVREVYRASSEGNQVLITHGTDTLAYTSSAISFAIRNPQTSVVLTGSMKKLEDKDSDVAKNLSDAVSFLGEKVQGVYVVFYGKVMTASRITKVNSVSLNAFDTVDSKYVAVIDGGNVVYHLRPTPDPNAKMILSNRFDNKVYTLKLTPGLPKEVFEIILKKRYKGIVIEAFGLGHVPFIENKRDPQHALGFVRKMIETARKIPVVVTTQAAQGGADPRKYEVGRKIEMPPVISGEDMSSETCHVKLMWCLGQGMNVDQVRKAFETNLVEEITILRQ